MMACSSLSSRPCSLRVATSNRRSIAAFSAGGQVQRVARVRVAPSTPAQGHGLRSVAVRSGSDDGKQVTYSKEFGYSRKDVILIGVGLTALGYGLYYGLQATGMEPGLAGNWVQLIIFMGICVGWISTYIFRVATKQMTYVKQLENYEEAVMRKRIEEMTDAELSELADEVEQQKGKPRGQQ